MPVAFGDKFHECFTTGILDNYDRNLFDDRCKALSVALNGWALVTAGKKPPQHFGRIMFLLGQIVGEPLTQDKILKIGDEYAREQERRSEKLRLNGSGLIKRRVKAVEGG